MVSVWMVSSPAIRIFLDGASWDLELLATGHSSYWPLELAPPKLYSAFSVYPRAPTHDGLVGFGGARVNICITSFTFTSF